MHARSSWTKLVLFVTVQAAVVAVATAATAASADTPAMAVSPDWSGYVATGTPDKPISYSSVTGTWTVPTATCGKGDAGAFSTVARPAADPESGPRLDVLAQHHVLDAGHVDRRVDLGEHPRRDCGRRRENEADQGRPRQGGRSSVVVVCRGALRESASAPSGATRPRYPCPGLIRAPRTTGPVSGALRLRNAPPTPSGPGTVTTRPRASDSFRGGGSAPSAEGGSRTHAPRREPDFESGKTSRNEWRQSANSRETSGFERQGTPARSAFRRQACTRICTRTSVRRGLGLRGRGSQSARRQSLRPRRAHSRRRAESRGPDVGRAACHATHATFGAVWAPPGGRSDRRTHLARARWRWQGRQVFAFFQRASVERAGGRPASRPPWARGQSRANAPASSDSRSTHGSPATSMVAWWIVPPTNAHGEVPG